MCSIQNKKLLIFGGLHEITNEIADLVEFDTETKLWKFHEKENKDAKKSSLYDIFNSVGKFVNHSTEPSKHSIKSSRDKRSNSHDKRSPAKPKFGKVQINLQNCDKNSKNFTFR